MIKKALKVIGVVWVFIAIVGLIIYCFILTQTINKQTIFIENQNGQLNLMRLENMIQIDSGFRSQTSTGASYELPPEFENKDLSLYIVEYKGDEKINEQLISKHEFIEQPIADTQIDAEMNYCYFKILTNEEKNEMQYGIAISFENGGSWAVNVPAEISAKENTTATDNITSSSGGFLTSDANNSYIIEQTTFGEYKVIVYVVAE